MSRISLARTDPRAAMFEALEEAFYKVDCLDRSKAQWRMNHSWLNVLSLVLTGVAAGKDAAFLKPSALLLGVPIVIDENYVMPELFLVEKETP